MNIRALCKSVKDASTQLNVLSSEKKNEILRRIADLLEVNIKSIISANELDIKNAHDKPKHIIDRLMLNESRICAMSDGVRKVIALDEPIGRVLEEWTTAKGLNIKKTTVPFGVVGIIYEARPNVTIDTTVLCIKSGNSVVLRGSKDALNSNRELVRIVKLALEGIVSTDCVGLIEDITREGAVEFMTCDDSLDVLVPRGSYSLIKTAMENATMPVIETGTGNCHVYIEASADIEMAKSVLLNAKTSRVSVCNSCESLLIDKSLAGSIPDILDLLHNRGVEIRGCDFICSHYPQAVKASEQDYYEEFLGMIISAKAVDGVEDAVRWINKHGTRHSEAIITSDEKKADYFLTNVDAAAVYHNASTRFTDGFEFGFGAELGISTQKLHARGPIGLKELTSYKYIVRGNGNIR